MPLAPTNLEHQPTAAPTTSHDEAPGITIVAPCCNEAESLPELRRSLERCARRSPVAEWSNFC